MTTDIDDILKLPVEERLEIMEKIWESIQENDSDIEIPQWHREILEERFQKHQDNLAEGKSWEEVKMKFFKFKSFKKIMTTNINDILKLPVEERLGIMEKIWESLDENVPYDEDEINIAKERYEEYKKNPESTLDWNDVKKELFQKYGLGNQD